MQQQARQTCRRHTIRSSTSFTPQRSRSMVLRPLHAASSLLAKVQEGGGTGGPAWWGGPPRSRLHIPRKPRVGEVQFVSMTEEDHGTGIVTSNGNRKTIRLSHCPA